MWLKLLGDRCDMAARGIVDVRQELRWGIGEAGCLAGAEVARLGIRELRERRQNFEALHERDADRDDDALRDG